MLATSLFPHEGCVFIEVHINKSLLRYPRVSSAENGSHATDCPNKYKILK